MIGAEGMLGTQCYVSGGFGSPSPEEQYCYHVCPRKRYMHIDLLWPANRTIIRSSVFEKVIRLRWRRIRGVWTPAMVLGFGKRRWIKTPIEEDVKTQMSSMRKFHVKREVGVLCRNRHTRCRKGTLRRLATSGTQSRLPSRESRRNCHCHYLDLGLWASRTMRELVSAVHGDLQDK